MRTDYDEALKLLLERGFLKARVRGANQLLVHEPGKISLSITKYHGAYYLMTWSPQAYAIPSLELIPDICASICEEKHKHNVRLPEGLVAQFGLKLVEDENLLDELIEWQSIDME